MKSAPGGQLPIQDIFGRDAFIAEIWRILESNSVRMEAERRIGKTHILKKMAAQPPDGWEPILLDLEDVHSAAEFAERVCEKIQGKLVGWKKEGTRLLGFLGMLKGAQLGPVTFPQKSERPEGYWKKLLTHSVEDLVEQQASSEKRVVFLFDELSWMLSAIADPKRDGPQTAMEVLDVLRALRQSPTTGQGFRMVLCGSIGMHHVVGTLKKEGYKNQPVNDMRLLEVPPLEPDLATELASQLLAGEGLSPKERAVSSKIAEETGGFPYYIHWVVSTLRMKGRGVLIVPDDINQALSELLTSAHDPCDLRHFKKRLEGYYPGQEPVVLGVLDHAARAVEPVRQSELINIAKTAGASDENQIRELLRLLVVDHYLLREADGRYRFRHELLRRWWVFEQGLN